MSRKGWSMRKASLAFLLLVVVIGVGWAGLWGYGASEAGRRLDAWMLRESSEGRRWTCPGRTMSGFPFAIEVACDHPTFAGPVLGDLAQGSLAAVRARVSLGQPRRASLVLTAPFAYATADGQTDVSITWTSMLVDIDGLLDGPRGGAASGADIAFNGRFGTPEVQSGHAAKGVVSITPVPEMAVPAVDFTIAFGGAAIPALDDLVGGTDLNDVDLAGRLTQAVIVDAPSTPALLEQWRRSGGSIMLASGRIVRGAARVEASGPLALDAGHRVTGRLDTSFVGLAPVLRRYGIDPNIATAGSILNSLFGKSRGPKPSDDPSALRLPIRFQDGHLGIGPVLTPIELPALY